MTQPKDRRQITLTTTTVSTAKEGETPGPLDVKIELDIPSLSHLGRNLFLRDVTRTIDIDFTTTTESQTGEYIMRYGKDAPNGVEEKTFHQVDIGGKVSIYWQREATAGTSIVELDDHREPVPIQPINRILASPDSHWDTWSPISGSNTFVLNVWVETHGQGISCVKNIQTVGNNRIYVFEVLDRGNLEFAAKLVATIM